jgi:murein L,D-transpeptidase YafK
VGSAFSNVRADRIVVRKAARRLEVMRDGQVLRSYRIALGRQPVGPKERDGDHRTPEGRYIIDRRNPASAFHLSLHISYPNDTDIARSSRLGVPPSGDITIHGLHRGYAWLGRFHRLWDWTAGGIAVTNLEIEQIWNVVSEGTDVEIVP